MLHRLQMAMCREDIQNQGLMASQLPFVLCLTHENRPVTQDYLSRKLAIDKGTTARALGQLEKNGFITRTVNPENRRQKLVVAAPKAHVAAEALFTPLCRATQNFVQDFSETEKQTVLKFMDRMLLNAQNTPNFNE